QQLGVVRQRQGKQIFYLHPAGELFVLFPLIQSKATDGLCIQFIIPVRVTRPGNRRNGREFLQRVKVDPSKHDADPLLALFFVPAEILLEQGDAPAVRLDHVQDRFERCTFPRPVFADQPHDAMGRKGKTDMLQGEAGIALPDVPDVQHRFHSSPSVSSGVTVVSKAVWNSRAIPRKNSSFMSAIPGCSGFSSPKTTSLSPGLIPNTSLACLGRTICPRSPTRTVPNRCLPLGGMLLPVCSWS